jgi:hypothetical protein
MRVHLPSDDYIAANMVDRGGGANITMINDKWDYYGVIIH